MLPNQPVLLALADDHELVRKALVELLHIMGTFKVVIEAKNGQDLISQFSEVKTLPNICLLDINMPVMNGFETIDKLKEKFPEIKVLVLSAHHDEHSVMRMIQKGASGYLTKDVTAQELNDAILQVYKTGAYHSDLLNNNVFHLIHTTKRDHSKELSDKEVKFLEYCCSDYSYEEIAEKMNLSKRTVEGYRDVLFGKIKVRSRVGLALFATRSGLVT